MEELDSNKKEASLSALTRRRTQVKGRVTRIKTFVDNFDPKIQSIGLLSARLEALNTCWSEFNVIQGEIDALQVEEAKLDDFLHSRQSTYIQDRTSNTVSSHAVEPTLRLPEINIPSFSGSYEEWLSFKETYLALIHNNSSLNDIQRFHYLKSCLKDTAIQLIQSLDVSAANYHVAWELLITRFENKKLIVNKHLNSIFQLQNLGKDSASSVRYFLDTLQKPMRALQSLGLPTEHWDAMIVHIIINKFDQMTRHAWENSTSSTEIATYTELINFLEKRSKVLEGCSEGRKVNSDNVHPSSVPQRKPLPSSRGSFVATNSSKCPICKAFHKLFQCNVFLQLKPSDRISKVRELQLCYNCLKAGHKSASSASSHSCKTCKKRHNSLLHLDVQQHGNVSLQSPSVTQESSHSTDAQTSSVATCSSSNDSLLLATAIVNIQNNQGSVFPCRMLLDSGSQSNFITESLANSLGLRRYKSSVVVNGINGKLSTIKHNVRTIIRSRFNGYQQELEFSIIPKITDNLPTHLINRQALQVPKKINLADPQFDVPHKVDGLLGAEVFFKLLCIGQIKMQENQPILQKTLLGWVLCGRMNSQEKGQVNNQIYCNFSQSAKLEDLMSSFWEIETNYSNTRLLSYQEKLCEEHYLSHVSRTPLGRIMVQLPFSNEENQLDSSRDQALLRFESLERRFAKNLPLKQAYTAFMEDYLRSGHMELADDCISGPHYYMPHHPVFKDTSSTTKIRVVFDASSKTSTGVSLNQALMVGPTIQRDLFDILSFRFPVYVFSADIKQMYRQILVDPAQRNFQLILWRNNPDKPVRTYKLTTVTYGTSAAPAPYLAIRSLHYLADQESQDYAHVLRCIKEDFYVDDVLSGTDSLDSAKQLQRDLTLVLQRGGFKLHKWCANNSELLKNVDSDKTNDQYIIVNCNGVRKTLGVYWKPTTDTFHYQVIAPPINSRVTKRTILSEICRLFDPLGLVSPVVITAKFLMQTLWQLDLSWDEDVPHHIHTSWVQYRKQLGDLNNLVVQRRISSQCNISSIEIHGFCDASEKGYGACLYIRCQDDNGNISTSLLCAKSRVAPIKTVCLPRLELCGAMLLARLAHKVSQTIQHQVQSYTYWTDSTVVLHWLSSSPHTLKSFVANRVSEVQTLTETGTWTHVQSQDNPADILSRGTTADQLAHNSMWWHGPEWLTQPKDSWPKTLPESSPIVDNLVKQEKKSNTAVFLATELDFNLKTRYSCWAKLIRITAYCLRFVKNLRARLESHLPIIETKSLTVQELEHSRLFWIKHVQHLHFNEEITDLSKNGLVKGRSSIRSLAPFIDSNGLIRVGGRLRRAKIDYDHKYPILLPAKDNITELIIRREHLLSLHSGAQSLLAHVRRQFWPINGKVLTKRVLRNCITCSKVNPRNINQPMGDLPVARITPSRPFVNCGVDYCGPFQIKQMQRKCRTTFKTHVALFICMVTKAIHLEIVTDLTTSAFLAALRRFTARRGYIANLYCNNATTFVGAKNELQRFLQSNKETLVDSVTSYNITWHFIPANSPHFGGLWEAGVKTVKHHLKCTVGTQSLNYEEFCTLLAQIEACVNSRPLTPLSSDPNDLVPLTPAHFLIGSPLTAIPDHDLSATPPNRLKYWQRVQQLMQSFWKRWSAEYLSTLQQRTKWTSAVSSIQPGTLVLTKEDFRPPFSWNMGRIVHLHPDEDNVPRVATVKTSSGLCRRALVRLCPLPTEPINF